MSPTSRWCSRRIGTNSPVDYLIGSGRFRNQRSKLITEVEEDDETNIGSRPDKSGNPQ